MRKSIEFLFSVCYYIKIIHICFNVIRLTLFYAFRKERISHDTVTVEVF